MRKVLTWSKRAVLTIVILGLTWYGLVATAEVGRLLGIIETVAVTCAEAVDGRFLVCDYTRTGYRFVIKSPKAEGL